MTFSCTLSVLLLFISLNCVQPRQLKDEHPFDLLIFTQFWPVTVCNEWRKQNPSHHCTMPGQHDSWSIHGIWPTRLGTKLPAFCNRTWQFDPEQVLPIENELINLWPNIEDKGAVYSLWAHEWNKHGTCAAVLEPLNSELKYFSRGLDWVQKYNMLDILGSANIVPSDTKNYLIEDIHQAVVNKIGVRPAIECDKGNGKNYIVELRICFNKTLELTNCDGIAGPPEYGINTNCNPASDVYYLENVYPNSYYVQLYKLTSWLQWFTL